MSRSEFLYAVRGCGLGGSVKSPHKESGLFFLQVLYTHCLRVYNMSNVHLSRAKSVNIWPFSPSTRPPYYLKGRSLFVCSELYCLALPHCFLPPHFIHLPSFPPHFISLLSVFLFSLLFFRLLGDRSAVHDCHGNNDGKTRWRSHR